MILFRIFFASLGCFVLSGALVGTHAADLKVLQSRPSPNAVLTSASDGFSIQFSQPIDHINSRLHVKRGTEIVETLVPRLESAPNALFARAPALPNGDYTLHWVVRTMTDAKIEEGDVPFSILIPK